MKPRLFLGLLAAGAISLCAALSVAAFDLPTAFAEEKKKEEISQETIRVELIQDIKAKQEELARREEELKRREDSLKALETDIDKKIEELKRLQAKLDEMIKIRGDLQDESVTALSKAYSSMPPEEAAARLKTMERGIALKILMQMKSKSSAKILSNMDPATATEISEQLAKLKIK